jgi:hypothetical protein
MTRIDSHGAVTKVLAYHAKFACCVRPIRLHTVLQLQAARHYIVLHPQAASCHRCALQEQSLGHVTLGIR